MWPKRTGGSSKSVAAPTASPAVAKSPSREVLWLLRLRWPAMVAGLLLTGAGITYLLVPPTIVTGGAIEVNPADLIAAQEREAQPMPSVLGLNRDVAGSVMSDAGLGDATTKVVERPAAGPVGIVLAQTPSPGTDPVENVELTVSVPAPMPDVMAKPLNDARTTLESLGAVVEVVPRFDPSVPKDQVIEAAPPVGGTMPTLVTLTVADPGDALTLASVTSVTRDDCGTIKSATVSGKAFGNSIECDSGSDPAYIEYAVSRNAAAFEAVIGTKDKGGTGRATVAIIGDGRVLSVTDVALGSSTPVRVPIADILRLRIEVTTPDTDQEPTVVLGDARLLGLPQGLDAIAAG
jgi:hypothetical protein